jgi:hypothetical protein
VAGLDTMEDSRAVDSVVVVVADSGAAADSTEVVDFGVVVDSAEAADAVGNSHIIRAIGAGVRD